MTTASSALLAALLCGSAACATETADTPDIAPPSTDDPTIGEMPSGDTVASVDVARYLGVWFEVASIPQGFQRSCTATTATYGAIDDSTITVLNECRFGSLDGELVAIEGTASVVDPATRAKLEVDFGFGTSPYWIVDLGVPADDESPYPWAVVSTPERAALWVLSREPVMDDDRFDTILSRLEQRGFQPDRLELTLQLP